MTTEETIFFQVEGVERVALLRQLAFRSQTARDTSRNALSSPRMEEWNHSNPSRTRTSITTCLRSSLASCIWMGTIQTKKGILVLAKIPPEKDTLTRTDQLQVFD